MDSILRKATAADAGRIEELFVEMMKTICRTETADGYEAGYLDRYFSGNEDRIYVAEYEKEVIAFLSVEVHRDADLIYLDDFSVTKKFRGKGIGTRLIHTAEKYAEEIGIEKIVLHVEKTNEAAHRFYSRLGYSEVATEGNRIRMSKAFK